MSDCSLLFTGIIRGIDPVQKMFYVITSLSGEDLQSVNTLVKGSVTLPEQLQMDQVKYLDESGWFGAAAEDIDISKINL